jgi:hypothetical protein
MIFGRDAGNRRTDSLGDERHGSAGARVHFQNVDFAVLTANWIFIRPRL